MDALLVTSEGDPGEPVARGPGTPHLVQLHAQRHPAPVSSLCYIRVCSITRAVND